MAASLQFQQTMTPTSRLDVNAHLHTRSRALQLLKVQLMTGLKKNNTWGSFHLKTNRLEQNTKAAASPQRRRVNVKRTARDHAAYLGNGRESCTSELPLGLRRRFHWHEELQR